MCGNMIKYNGLFFISRKEPLPTYAEEEYTEFLRMGWGYKNGEVFLTHNGKRRLEYTYFEGRRYSLKQVAKALSWPLIFGDRIQIEALTAARLFQIILLKEGVKYTTIKELEKHKNRRNE
jgi:hypothetical protein